MPTLGAKIRQSRQRRGLTQRQLATVLRVSYPTVSRWETDADHPRGDHLIALAEHLEVPLGWLTSGESSDQPDRLVLKSTIPVFGYGSAGEGLEVDDSGYPVGHGEFEIMRSASNVDPNSYATRVKGVSMVPYFLDGDVIEVVTNVEVQSGDPAVVLHEDGRKWIKHVHFVRRRSAIRCVSVNATEQPFELPAEKVRLHKIVSIRRKGMY